MSRDREETIEFDRRYCQHFEPGGITMIGGKEPNGYCQAGVHYETQFPNPNADLPAHFGIFTRICCTSGGKRSEAEQVASCPKWERRTIEQATKRADDIEESMRQMRLVGPVIGKWRSWSKMNRVAKAEIIECPACKGRLHLSQAAYNGNVCGKCETAGCVEWME